VADCKGCHAVYRGKPPCNECKKPDWNEENLVAWRIWRELNERDRPVYFMGIGKLPTITILEVCDFYDATDLDFEKIKIIDDIMLPIMRESVKGKG
jgi:hypothetical protein